DGVDGSLDAQDAVATERQRSRVVAGLENDDAGVRPARGRNQVDLAAATERDAAEIASRRGELGPRIVDRHTITDDAGLATDDEAAPGNDVHARIHFQSGAARDVDLAVNARIDRYGAAVAQDNRAPVDSACRRCQIGKRIRRDGSMGRGRGVEGRAAGLAYAAHDVDLRRRDAGAAAYRQRRGRV